MLLQQIQDGKIEEDPDAVLSYLEKYAFRYPNLVFGILVAHVDETSKRWLKPVTQAYLIQFFPESKTFSVQKVGHLPLRHSI